MSIESLKQQARRHEQNEEWDQALEQYQKAIAALSKDDQSDIGLINRVGDLFARVGKVDQAVKYFEQAVDLYREAFLPNNAIAVCKKIIRSAPNRHQVYLKIGQIRAEQGFLPDARTNFLMYAERMQKSGNLDESFRALVEFCDLAPDDIQVRIMVADQMAANQRKGEAVQQLVVAYRHLVQSGEADLMKGIERKLRQLDPNIDLGAQLAAAESRTTPSGSDVEAQFGEIEIGGGAAGKKTGEKESFSGDTSGRFDLRSEPDEGVELPMMSFDQGGEEAGQADGEPAFELPMMSFEEAEQREDGAEEPAFELPMMSFDQGGGGEEAAEPVAELPMMSFDPEPDPPSKSLQDAFEEVRAAPILPSLREHEPRKGAPPLQGLGPATKAGGDGYVDLGAMILGGGDSRTTRFRVAYEEPTGDEGADFARMLSQFKEKVSENIDAGDVRAHYDLGTAYKEMGLLEEAIGAFQAALRASADHLPTYELMGQTFMEMGEPEAAVKTLQRALQVRSGVEDDFVGIYYYLGRAYQVLNKRDSAIEFYDRVFALDINFADVTERLRQLR